MNRSSSPKPVIIITGASSGIGKATAERFGRAGYRLVLAARREDRLIALAEQIQSEGGEVLPVKTDVSLLEDLEKLVHNTIACYGQVDILVNNAGFGRIDWLESLDPVADIAQQIQVNLSGLIQLTHLVLPYMVERRSGHVINIASLASWIPTPTYSVYAASKFGVRGFSNALQREVSPFNIKVTVMYPGGVDTEFKSVAGIKRKTGITTPAWLRLTADQVAEAVWRVSQHPRKTVVQPWIYWLPIWLESFFPGMVDTILVRRFTRPERFE